MKKMIISMLYLCTLGLDARKTAPAYDASKNTTTFKNMHAVHKYELKKAIKLYKQRKYDDAYNAFSDLAKLEGYPEIRHEAKRYMKMMVFAGHYSKESLSKRADALDARLKEADALRDAGKRKEAIEVYKEITHAPTSYAHGLNTTANIRLKALGAL
jgi:hypothetical protein